MGTPLVSIITPCYNSGRFVHVLLDSVLAQDYPAAEMWVIDDGSTDDTRQVVESYKPLFIEKGYTLEYVWQEHSGQSEAINKGLKLISGDYLVWPDSDDYYATSDALSLMVAELEKSGDKVGMVRCLPSYVDANGIDYDGYRHANFDKEDLFEDCLFGINGFWYMSGGYMAKTSFIDKYIPQRTISTAKNAGQNWQLMLPLLYGHKCLTIKKYLYKIVVRDDSHSRLGYRTYTELKRKYIDFEHVLVQTLERMNHLPYDKKRKYIKIVRRNYRKEHLKLWLKTHVRTWRIRCMINKVKQLVNDKAGK